MQSNRRTEAEPMFGKTALQELVPAKLYLKVYKVPSNPNKGF
jgi:hypothetical protein